MLIWWIKLRVCRIFADCMHEIWVIALNEWQGKQMPRWRVWSVYAVQKMSFCRRSYDIHIPRHGCCVLRRSKFTAAGYFCFIHSFALSHSLCCAPRFIRSHFNRSALFTVRIHFCMTEAWRCVVVDRTRDRTIFIVFRLDITYQFILLVLSRLTMFFVWFSFVVSCFFARFFVLLSLCFCA